MLQDKLQELASLAYDPKRIEVCVTDGGDDPELREVLKAAAYKFDQIKYAVSDRGELPFIVPENNPACDINAQVCHVASYELIIRTDPEIRFRRKDSLTWAVQRLKTDPELCVCFRSWKMPANFVLGKDDPHRSLIAGGAAKLSFHCSCFWKKAFIRNRGVDEQFAKGFAAEDSYFHQWWRKNRRLVNVPAGHEVLHLWHGRWESPSRLKLKKEYSMPLYKQYLKENHTPNIGNEKWPRPEMIKDVQIWK